MDSSSIFSYYILRSASIRSHSTVYVSYRKTLLYTIASLSLQTIAIGGKCFEHSFHIIKYLLVASFVRVEFAGKSSATWADHTRFIKELSEYIFYFDVFWR